MEVQMQGIRLALVGTALLGGAFWAFSDPLADAAEPVHQMTAGPVTAGQGAGAIAVYDGSGQQIGVLTPRVPGVSVTFAPAARPVAVMGGVADPFAMMARQAAMMQQIMERMDREMPGFGDPERMIQTAMHGFGPGMSIGNLPPGATGMLVTSVSDGSGGCAQTVTTTYTGQGATPKTTVQKVGDACGSVGRPALQGVPAALPDVAPRPGLPTDRLIRVEDHPAAKSPQRVEG
jgi:hypothetical protein